MTDFIQNPITELVDRPVPALEQRMPVDVTDFTQELLDFGGGMKHAKQAKVVSILGGVGVTAEVKKRDVTKSNPNDPSQTFMTDEEYVDGLPEDAQIIIENALNKRQDLLLETQETANRMLSELKPLVIDRLSDYAGRLGFNKEQIRLLIENRLSSITEVMTKDWVFDDNTAIDMSSDAGATYTANVNILSVRPWGINKGAEIRGKKPEKILRTTMIHELEHAASFEAIDDDGLIARTGVIAEHQTESKWRIPIRHGLLFEEGAQEDILWTVGLKEPGDVTFMPNVMVWRAAIAIDPTIEKDRFDAKFINTPGVRGRLVGKLENIFGPLAIEQIDEIISTNSALRDYPNLKDNITQMVQEADRMKVRSVLDQTQLDIFTPIGYGYSDEQLRDLKRTGIMPDKPAYPKTELETES